MIVDLHLHGGLVIIVGAGAEALKKINSLRTQDCKILVIAETAGPQIKKYAAEKKIRFKEARLKGAGFLSGYRPRMVMAATDDHELNRKIAKKARAMNCFAYASDDPKSSDFAHPSVINILDSVQVAVSTGGKSPVMAKKITQKAERVLREVIKKEDVLQIRLQERMREEAKKRLGTQAQRKRYLYRLAGDGEIEQLIKDGKLNMAQRRAMTLLKEWK